MDSHRFRSFSATLALLALLALLVGIAGPALAAPTLHKTKTFTGTSELNEGKNTMTWRAWFPVGVDAAVKGLSKWDKVLVLVEGGESLMVKERSPSSSLFLVKRSTPFFMPDMEILIRATLSTPAKGESLITWTQIEGPATSMKRVWHVRPGAGGTWIEHRTEIDLPFTPPSFMMGDVEEKLVHQVAAVRALIGAKHSSGKPPPVTPPTKPTAGP